MKTSEFLVWAVEFSCLVRGSEDGRDPERVERQLRVARAVSDAEWEGRVFEGVAVRGEEGFRIEEAMGVYGGRRAVEGACGNCPANAFSREGRRVLAGCYGMVVCPLDSESFHAAVDGVVEREWSAGNGRQDACPTTRLAWYGLWMGSPLNGARAEATAGILEAVEAAEPGAATGLGELALALRLAGERGLRVHVAVYPEGTDDGGVFALARHCPRCKRTWRLAQDRGVCPACGNEGFCAPVKKRRARGRRPYFPLERLLGEEGARELLRRVSGES